jgi:hypothetical protein
MSPLITNLVDSTPALLAYLDPGSGSMLFQVLVAGLLSAMVYWRAALRKVGEVFRAGVR